MGMKAGPMLKELSHYTLYTSEHLLMSELLYLLPVTLKVPQTVTVQVLI